MLFLGFDPGVAMTGYGLVEKKRNNKNFSLISFGCIQTLAKTPFDRRLSLIYYQVSHLLKYYKPSRIVVENIYFARNAKSAIDVSQVRGVILLAISQSKNSQLLRKIRIEELTPLQVKMAITGYGHASKLQVQEKVKKILNLKEIPKPDDAADALALAITYAQMVGSKKVK